LTTQNLQYLTLENSVADLAYFANTVSLPFDPNNTSQAAKAVSPSSPPAGPCVLTVTRSRGCCPAARPAER
jgi:hypothetical protein